MGPGRHGVGRRPGRRRRQHEPRRRRCGDGTDPLSRAIDELSASSETLFVVAAGNNGGNGPDTITAPGAADAALTVGAVDGHDTLACFSSRGPRLGDHALKPDVVAPASTITAARAAGTSLGNPVDEWYTDLDGTSMATPHVAGLAAILKQEHPGWDGEQLKDAVADTHRARRRRDGLRRRHRPGRRRARDRRHDRRGSVAAARLLPLPAVAARCRRARPLTYTNLGTKAVTLALALDAEDRRATRRRACRSRPAAWSCRPGGAAMST